MTEKPTMTLGPLSRDGEARRVRVPVRVLRETEDRAGEAARARAVQFVQSLFAGNRRVEVHVVCRAAAAEGIATADLLYAAARAGVRRLGWVRSATSTVHQRAEGRFWGIPTR